MSHGHGDTVPLQSSSQSDIYEMENLINASATITVLPARPLSPPRSSIPVSSSPFISSKFQPSAATSPPTSSSKKSTPDPQLPATGIAVAVGGISSDRFGPAPNMLTEPVWDTMKRDLSRILSNLKLVFFSNPFREDPGKALRDWDLWGTIFFIVFFGLVLS